jgi:HAE1 family hydrophobic/amphiphilic exporter-1
VSLPAFSVRQVVLVNVVFVLLMVAGLLVARRIPVDLFPDISFNSAIVVTVWRGASPEEVERLVTRKLEDEIEGISGIKELRSFSRTGSSEIDIEWDETLSELEYESALADLRAAIDRADDLPEDAEVPLLRELSVSEAFNILMVAVSDVGGVGEYAIREIARDLRDRLERIPGLRRADMRGARDREIRVLVDADRARQYDLTLAEIDSIIARNNQNFAGGSFTDPARQEIRVRGVGQFPTAERLSRTVVRKDPDGSHVLLEDVAEVVSGFEKRRLLGRYNGSPAVVLGISKEADRDIVELVREVHRYLAGYAATLPDGVELSATWDSGAYVEKRMSIMRDNLALGVVFVVFILWLTLGLRNALVAIVGVPFSFLAALLLFPVFDITVNSLSLVGFVMVSGMLVDGAIIILENIYRRIEEGEPLVDAAIHGSEEVMWPVVAAVATTIAAFLPMLLVTGTSGEFMSILPKTVIACLLASLLEVLVVLPAHYMDWGSRRRTRESPEVAHRRRGLAAHAATVRAAVDAGLERLREVYLAAQAPLLAQRGLFLLASVAALFFSCGLAQHLPVDLFPSDFNRLYVAIETPADFGIEQTDEVVRGAERALLPIAHELIDVSSYSGLALSADNAPERGVNRGSLYLAFPSTPENVADPGRVLRLVRERVEAYAQARQGEIVSLRVAPPRQGPPIGKPVAIRIQSDDYRQAKRIAEEMKAELATMAGVYNIEDNVQMGPRELQVSLHEHRASIHGLAFQDVGFALMAANDGSVSSTFRDPTSDEDVDIRVQLREDQRRSIADLLEVEIRTPAGYRVELGDVADIEVQRGYQQIYHYDGQRTVVVYADVDDEQATSISVNEQMKARFADEVERLPGVSLVFGGEYQDTDAAFADMRRAFGVAAVAIFGILAAQFRSYLQPLIVMSVIAFSFIGVTVGMWAMNVLVGGYALSMYVVYAVVGLAGIVVNDSLVLIDFVNRERRRGTLPLEAVRIASRKRFRPILLTTVTTIAGLAPMATGLSGYSHVFGPFATAIVFGLVVASMQTLFLVPALYLVVEGSRQRLRRALGREPGGGGVGTPFRAARRAG